MHARLSRDRRKKVTRSKACRKRRGKIYLQFSFNNRDVTKRHDTVGARRLAFSAPYPYISLQYNYSRMLWDMETVQPSGHLSGFVDKALKLLDLRQVMMEVETSVMSKVSCTACKVGAGLLQHYIKSGKSDEEIMASIYQFCVSLNIQSPRVCQGVTMLFGVKPDTYSSLSTGKKMYIHFC